MLCAHTPLWTHMSTHTAGKKDLQNDTSSNETFYSTNKVKPAQTPTLHIPFISYGDSLRSVSIIIISEYSVLD